MLHSFEVHFSPLFYRSLWCASALNASVRKPYLLLESERRRRRLLKCERAQRATFPTTTASLRPSPSRRLSPPFRRGRRRAPRASERARGDGRQRRRWRWLFLSFALSGAHAAFLPMLAPLRSLLYSQCEFGRDRVRTCPAPRGTTIALDGRKEGHVLHRLIRKGQKRLQGKTATVPFPLLLPPPPAFCGWMRKSLRKGGRGQLFSIGEG